MPSTITPMEVGLLPDGSQVAVTRDGETIPYWIRKQPDKWVFEDAQGNTYEHYEIMAGSLPDITVMD